MLTKLFYALLIYNSYKTEVKGTADIFELNL